MSTNRTPNYNLNQWKKSDQVLMEDFNADNVKIDAAIKAVDARVDGKASTSSVSSLTTALNALSATVSGHTGALEQKGNCILYTTTYTGNGKSGAANARSLTFPHKPVLVLIVCMNLSMIMVQGAGSTAIHTGRLAINNALSWNGNSVSWYCTDSSTQDMMNDSGLTYRVVALLDAEN